MHEWMSRLLRPAQRTPMPKPAPPSTPIPAPSPWKILWLDALHDRSADAPHLGECDAIVLDDQALGMERCGCGPPVDPDATAAVEGGGALEHGGTCLLVAADC